MKRVLIIMANHSPDPSSVANCMAPFINRISESFKVDIITDRKKLDVSKYETDENISIYRVDDYRSMNTTYCNKLNEINSTGLLRIITRIFTWILKSFYYIQYVLFAKERGTGGWQIKRVYKKCCELAENNRYDLMISVSLPFQSHYIAEKIKNIKDRSLNWIVFEFDPFYFNKEISANKIMKKRMYKEEKRILKKCDCICLTPELYEFYKKINFIQYNTKVNMMPFATMEEIKFDLINVKGNFMKKSKINCLFTGQLYSDIRNPKTLLQLFSKIDDNDIHLSLMTNFTIERIKEYAPEGYLPSVIAFQNRDTALYNLLKADILVNIGNTVDLQVPAKIFEYMSTGKPIIHFSKNKNDPSIKYFKRYPLALVVDEWDVNKRDYEKAIKNFCIKNRNMRFSFEEVNVGLGEYSGKAVSDKFMHIVNDMAGYIDE